MRRVIHLLHPRTHGAGYLRLTAYPNHARCTNIKTVMYY